MASALGNAKSVSIFAPASVGNVGVGFDVLGHAIAGVGDTVTVNRCDEPGVRVTSISGVVTDLPDDQRNTAAAAIMAMARALELDSGFEIEIDKGISLGSGMGGSAASAAAAVFAVNMMLKIPLPTAELFPYALAGEAAASGEVHGDNVGPALLGGLTISGPAENPRVVQVKMPNTLRCVLVHPNMKIETSASRNALPDQFERRKAVAQMANLAAFLAGCFHRDLDLIAASLQDLLIEDVRSPGIPGFGKVKRAAMDHGALGCSISGSGPSVFAWFSSESASRQAAEAMVAAFGEEGLEAVSYVSPINSPGARQV